MNGETVCDSRESRYVPWTHGETFECLTCGHRAIQHHNTLPLRNPSGQADYDSVYPFPEHQQRTAGAR